jgi:hypothetical protein
MKVLLKKQRNRLTFTIIAVVLLMTILPSCAQDASPSLEELAVIANTIETPDIQSCLAIWSGTETSRGEKTELYQESAFAAPASYHIRFKENGDISEFVDTGDIQYIKSSSLSPAVMAAFTHNMQAFITPEYGLNLLEQLVKIEALPPEEINDVECFHYSGTIDMESQWKEMISTSIDPAQPDYEELKEKMEAELERIRKTTMDYEIWIGSDDLLLRQMTYSAKMPSEEQGQWDTSLTTVQLSAINKPLTIEPPLDDQGELLPGWKLSEDYSPGITFTSAVEHKISGDDPSEQQIDLAFTITNSGIETAGDIKVELQSIVPAEQEGEDNLWIEAIPSESGPVELAPKESKTFTAGYACDLSRVAPEKINTLLQMTRLRITYITSSGHEKSIFIQGDTVYPSEVPPAEG